MSMDIHDDSDNAPIDLFAPRVSQESYAFPVEHFIPSMKKEPLDEPASLEPVEEQNVEVNPNNPEGTLVDVVETATIPKQVSIGLEGDGITDTPLDPLPATTDPEARVSLEQDLEELEELNTAYSAIRFNGGISREDVARIETNYPGIITKQKPLNAFSSVVSVCGYEVSCESISDRIFDLIERIIAGIGRVIDKLLNANRFSLPTMGTMTGGRSTLKSRWKDIETLASRLDSIKPVKDLAARVPGSDAARKSSTLKHFIRLYSVELIRMKTEEVVAGYNLVGNNVARQDLIDIDNNLSKLLTEVNRSIASSMVISFPAVSVGEFRERYQTKVKGLVPNIEKIVAIEMPDDLVVNIRKHVSTLNEIKRDLEKQKTTMVGNTTATNTLKSVASAIIAAEAYSSRMSICLEAYSQYNNIVGMSLDQVSNKLQLFKI